MNNDKLNIFYTGLSSDNSALDFLISSEKVNFVHFPTIEIIEHELSLFEMEKIKNPDKYDFIIFTSINSVKYFLKYFDNNFSKICCKAKVIAIGQKTASLLLKNNIDVDLIPHSSSSESIDALLTSALINNKLILIPGSNLSKTDLFNSLESKGALVDFVAIYDNVVPENISQSFINRINLDDFDLFVFTSPSTFYNFVSIFKIENVLQFFAQKTIATIGPVTKEALQKDNLEVQIVPNEYNLTSLTKEIKNYYKLN
jgi:uroporphyrinogen-III synthase